MQFYCILEAQSNMGKSCDWTLTLLAAHLQTFLPAGNLVHKSIERVTLRHVPLEVVCDVVTFFESVKEMTCVYIKDPQQV